jgi:osmotically-inducible protein OsmY
LAAAEPPESAAADIDKAVQVARGVAGVTSVKNDKRIK